MDDGGDAGVQQHLRARRGKGKNASEAATAPFARSPALATASRAADGRSIWPAPAPRSIPSPATTIALLLTCLQTSQAKLQIGHLLLGRLARLETTFQADSSSPSVSRCCTRNPPTILCMCNSFGVVAADRPDLQQAHVFPSLAQQLQGVCRQRRGDDHFQQLVDRRDGLGRGKIDRAIERHDPAERGQRIALERAAKSRRPRSSAVAHPQGVACLTMHAAGAAIPSPPSRARVGVEQVDVRQFLAVKLPRRRRPTPRPAFCRREASPSGAGSRRSADPAPCAGSERIAAAVDPARSLAR